MPELVHPRDATSGVGSDARGVRMAFIALDRGEFHEQARQVNAAASDLAAEFKVIAALEGTSVPAPRALWLDADGSGLGAPTVIMERVAGVTDILALRAAEPAQRNRAVALAFADAAAKDRQSPARRRFDIGSQQPQAPAGGPFREIQQPQQAGLPGA